MYTITLKDIKFIIKVLVCHILAITTITKLNKRPTDLDGHPSTTAHRRICQRVTCLHFKLHLWVLTLINPRLLCMTVTPTFITGIWCLQTSILKKGGCNWKNLELHACIYLPNSRGENVHRFFFSNLFFAYLAQPMRPRGGE